MCVYVFQEQEERCDKSIHTERLAPIPSLRHGPVTEEYSSRGVQGPRALCLSHPRRPCPALGLCLTGGCRDSPTLPLSLLGAGLALGCGRRGRALGRFLSGRQNKKLTFSVGRTMRVASEKVNCNHSLLGTVFHGNFSQKEKGEKTILS